MKVFLIFSFLLFRFSTIYSQEVAVIQKIDSLLKSNYKQTEPGAVILVAQKNKIILRKGYGLANLEQNVKISPKHIFKISSITKPITALAILKLINEKRLKLSDSVTQYLPLLDKKYSKVEIRHLLSHTSGIINYTSTDEYESLYSKYYFRFVNNEISSDSIFSIVNKYELQFEPGEKFSYCNTGYFLLEKIIENVTRDSFEYFLTKQVLDPLKMTNTRFYSLTEIIPSRVQGYTFDDKGKIVNNPFSVLSGIITKGPGGLMSTIDDLYSFCEAILHKKSLRTSCYNEFTTPFQLNDSSYSYYSYGFFIRKLKRKKLLIHNGDGPGFSSSMLILPNDSINVIILGNSDLYSKGSSRFHENIAKRITAILMQDEFPDFKEKQIDTDFQKYIGSYKSDDGTVRTISSENNKLYYRKNNNPQTQIFPFDNSKFFFKGYLIQLIFNSNSKGIINSLTIEYDDGRIIEALKI